MSKSGFWRRQVIKTISSSSSQALASISQQIKLERTHEDKKKWSVLFISQKKPLNIWNSTNIYQRHMTADNFTSKNKFTFFTVHISEEKPDYKFRNMYLTSQRLFKVKEEPKRQFTAVFIYLCTSLQLINLCLLNLIVNITHVKDASMLIEFNWQEDLAR
jgi:hypothetical protein